jgi:catechol 2,3-dioxygenase-like lactoylglutathione lyase family enzyme
LENPVSAHDSSVLRLHHGQVSIPKGSEDKAREFYCGFLGLKEVEKPESLKGRGGFWLELGELQIHFGAEDGVDRKATKSHLAYEVSNLNSWKEKFRTSGIEILDGIPIPGWERFEFRDPFGNRVEFLERLYTER